MSMHRAPRRGFMPTPAVRRYVYGTFLAAGPVVLFYGLLTSQEFLLWAGLLGSVLGLPNGLALANTTTKDQGTP